MDEKMAFLNGNLQEIHGTTQPFCPGRKEHMGYCQKKSIYGLKQASRQ